MLDAGKPVALTDDASTLLIDADIASGRSIAAPKAIVEQLQSAGATIIDSPMHIDGHLITLTDTEATEDFILAIKSALGFDETQSEEAA